MTVPEYIYAELINAGFTKEGACAMLGNIQEESGFQTNNLENRANSILGLTDEEYTQLVDSGRWTDFATDNGVHGGYGLIQVTLADRKRYYLDFMKLRGKSIADLEGQVAFIIWEMKHMFPSVWNVVTYSNNLYDCTWKILDVYENPKEKTENMKRRYAYAQQWLAQLGSKEVLRRMTRTEAIEIILNIARNEIGQHEKASNSNLDDKTANNGSGNYTKYARDLDAVTNFYNGLKNGYPWCDVWYDWLHYKAWGAALAMKVLCQPERSAGAGCYYSAQYYKDAGRWVTTPQPGDQIFFTYAPGEYSHTGLVESVANGMVNTIEGNSSDQVARRSYPLSSGAIIGYGRPNWDAVSGVSAADIAASAQAPSGSSGGSRILRRGSKGADVMEMQEKLLKLGYDLGKYGADGDFGNDTYNAVVLFQKEHGLSPVDGEVGNDTAAAIEEAMKNPQKKEYADDAGSGPVYTTAGVIKPDPVHVIVKPIEDEEPPDDGFAFHEGDIVNFIGNGFYFTSKAKVGIACKAGRAMVTAMDKTAAAKHPYRIRAIRGGGSTVNGWVDTDAIQAI